LLNSQASVKFGGGQRSNINGNTADRSPGPVYEVRTKPDSKTNTKFPQDDRFATNKLQASPPPGAYEALTQFDGTRLAKSFGCSFEAYRKVKTEGIERELRGRTSTGPGVYTENFGKNLPGYTFTGVYSFPRAERMKHRTASTTRVPGPGAYVNVKVLEVYK
jgi:hypothetical protein